MQNPKALALFLMTFLKLEKLRLLEQKDLIEYMVQRLIVLRSPQELITGRPARSSVISSPMSSELCPLSSDQASQPSRNQPFESAQDFQLSATSYEP